ncbi:MAG: hypothetical protein KF699_11825 [Phycisphaeraceae bacterium]|nr:hypothetical protein [Phycisphaeraceae bacterium]MBX3407213.1 hypothetical protein [Phycisphaeraceae bacterium]
MSIFGIIRRTPASRAFWSALVCAWLGSIAAGIGTMARFDWTPGSAGPAPRTWPPACAIKHDFNRPTLVVAIHPRCPCSAATLTQVEALAERHAAECRLIVLMLAPSVDDPAWTNAPAWRAARSIAGVEVVADALGGIAGAFGARTSGHAVLFGRDGRLMFSGGLTLSRAHEGVGPGAAAVDVLIRGGEAANSAPVFGCALFGPDDLCGPPVGERP